MSNHNHNAVTPTTGIWAGLYEQTMRRAFARSKCRGYIRFVNDPASISTGGLGEWRWERMFPQSQSDKTEYMVLKVIAEPKPKHHGMIGREAALAHMLMHIERGTQCSSWDPMHWSEECKAVEWEAMNRMGWAPANCDSYDPLTGEWTEYLTGIVTRNA